MSQDEILSELTPEQLAAVTHMNGPLLVLAGAGSGKTRVVTKRIAWLICRGVWPEQILAMTFTNKAAREMRARVAQMTGREIYNLGTFHGCCARFLRRDIDKLDCGRTRDFTIYDDDDQRGIFKALIKAQSYLPHFVNPGLLSSIVSTAKNNRESFACAIQDMNLGGSVKFLLPLCDAYEQKLRECNAVDFDDLLVLMARLLEERPDVRDVYRNRFRYILIDEYQDTNHLQYELIKLLINDERNLHVTGDPDQCIYSWRGADYSNIMNFSDDFPNAKVIKLEKNYRSTKTILKAANSLIRQNQHRFPKDLFTDNMAGHPITLNMTESDRQEAALIANQLMQLHSRGVEWQECAIFYRTNAQSRLLEEQFINYAIPYQLLGGLRFYERMEIRDFIALLRFYANHNDENALLRIVSNFPQANGIGPRTILNMTEAAREAGMSPFDYFCSPEFEKKFATGRTQKAQGAARFGAFIKKLAELPKGVNVFHTVNGILEASDMLHDLAGQYGEENVKNREENLNSMLQKAEIFGKDNPDATITEFLEDIALVADVDNHDPNADSVTLMTLHSSKGLEFPYVFIAGVEEGLLPHENCEEDNEEERRLFYVGLTRARKQVFLSYACSRFRRGHTEFSGPSPFLMELARDAVQVNSCGFTQEQFHQPAKFRNLRLADQVKAARSQQKPKQQEYDDDGLPIIILDD